MCQVGGEQTNPLAFGSDGPCEKEIESALKWEWVRRRIMRR